MMGCLQRTSKMESVNASPKIVEGLKLVVEVGWLLSKDYLTDKHCAMAGLGRNPVQMGAGRRTCKIGT